MFMLDTNVLSELARRSPSPDVLQWLADAGEVAVSAVTIDEIYFGLASRPSAAIQRDLEAYIAAYVTVHDVTAVIAKHAGVIRGQLARKGQVRSQSDMLIAATAAANGLTLATRDVRDFAGCGVALVNPFAK